MSSNTRKALDSATGGLRFRLPAPAKVEELMALLNGATIPNNLSLEKNQGGLYRLATGDQYILETYHQSELYAFLLGMFWVEFRGDELARIEEQVRFNRADKPERYSEISYGSN